MWNISTHDGLEDTCPDCDGTGIDLSKDDELDNERPGGESECATCDGTGSCQMEDD